MPEAFEFWATEYAQAKEAGVFGDAARNVGIPLMLGTGLGAGGGAMVGGGVPLAAGSAVNAIQHEVGIPLTQHQMMAPYDAARRGAGDGANLGALAGSGLAAAAALSRKK